MNLNSIAQKALEAINFSHRFEQLCIKHHKEKGMSKPDKKEIINVLSTLGYQFKYTDNCYIFLENWNQDIRSHTVFNIKYGVFIAYFNVLVNEKFIELNSGNIATMAYALNEKINTPGMPIFTTYEEFGEIAKEILDIYESFKNEFIILSQVN